MKYDNVTIKLRVDRVVKRAASAFGPEQYVVYGSAMSCRSNEKPKGSKAADPICVLSGGHMLTGEKGFIKVEELTPGDVLISFVASVAL